MPNTNVDLRNQGKVVQSVAATEPSDVPRLDQVEALDAATLAAANAYADGVIGGGAGAFVQLTGDTMTGALVIDPSTAGVIPITIAANPSNNTNLTDWRNASNTLLAYVDSTGSATFVQVTSSTSAPSAAGHLTRKDYVDGLFTAHGAAADPHPGYLTPAEGDAAYVNVSGDTMTGHLVTITPTANGHATNKLYVDGVMTTHTSASDPHSQYLTEAEGDARYFVVGGGPASANLHLNTTDTYSNLTDNSVPLTLGTLAADNLVLDQDKIQARSNNLANDLILQPYGGKLIVSASEANFDNVVTVDSSFFIQQDAVPAGNTLIDQIQLTNDDVTRIFSIIPRPDSVTDSANQITYDFDLSKWVFAGTVQVPEPVNNADVATKFYVDNATPDVSGDIAAAISAHEALSDPHPGYLTPAEGNAAYLQLSGGTLTGHLITITPTSGGHAVNKTYADGLITTHEGAGDPHPQYLTLAEGDAEYVNVTGDTLTGHLLGITPTAAAHLTRKDYVDGLMTSHVGAGDPHTQYVLSAGDTMTGQLILVGDPVAANDAARKLYVDNTASSAGSSAVATHVGLADPHTQYVLAAGDTMTGQLALVGDPVAANDAARKLFVENTATSSASAAVSTHVGLADPHTQYVLVAGDTMTGQLVLVGDPVGASDAVRKSYADGLISTHLAAGDPHPQYLTPAEGDTAYVNVGGDTMTGNLLVPQLGLADSDNSHRLLLRTTSNLTQDRLFTIITGDAARSLTLSADVELNQNLRTTDSPVFAQVTASTASPSAAGHLTRKDYVDGVMTTHVGLGDPHTQYLLSAGDTMSGDLLMAGNDIEMLAGTLALRGVANPEVLYADTVPVDPVVVLRADKRGALRTNFGAANTDQLTWDSATGVRVHQDLLVDGNLTISGTTSTIESQSLLLQDPIIRLGGVDPLIVNDGMDRGIEFRYYDTETRLGFMGWDNGTGQFVLLTNTTNISESITGTKGTLNANVDFSNILNYTGTLDARYVNLTGDTMTGHLITITPTSGGHAVNKTYADGLITTHLAAGDPHPQYLTEADGDALFLTPAEGDAAYVNITGDTMTGHLSGITPTAAAHLTRKDYVDLRVLRSGDTMTGHLSGITPTADGHLTRKDYVDGVMTTHLAAVDPHPQYLTEADGDALFLTPAEGDAAYVNVSGDTMTGHLTTITPTTGGHAVNKTYADGLITTHVGLADPHTQYRLESANVPWAEISGKPSPTITLGGDLTGSITLTELAGGTLTAVVLNDSHTHDTQYYTQAQINDFNTTINTNHTNHVTAAAGAHAATAISFAPPAGFVATTVQAAIVEAKDDAIAWTDAHLIDAADAHEASAISYDGTLLSPTSQLWHPDTIGDVQNSITTIIGEIDGRIEAGDTDAIIDAINSWTGGDPTITNSSVFSAGVIVTDALAAGAVVASKIAANTITASQIAASTITTSQIAANTIVAGNIAAGTITSTEINATSVRTAVLIADSITTSMIGANQVTANEIAANTITAAQIAAGTITGTQISASSSINIGTGLTAWEIVGTADPTTTSIRTTGATFANTTGIWLDASGRLRLGDSLEWDGTTLTIDGDGTFSGDISGASGTFTGNISGGTIDIGGMDDTSFHVDATGQMWMGNAAFGSAPFRVTAAGALTATGATVSGSITATSGTIGGWTAAATTLTGGAMVLTNTGNLTAGTSNNVVRLSADDATFRLWVGHATAASAPFRVTAAGALTATGATITGTVTATAGAIGGWTLGTTTLTGTNLVLTNTGNLAAGTSNNIVRISADDATFRLWAGHATAASAPFRVTAAGALTATSATITGTVTATAGAIGGITLASNKLYVGTGTYNNANTAFYVDNAGQFSLKNALSWDGTTLTIGGYATEQYVQSRGENLVTNGYGQLGTLRNFSNFTSFEPSDSFNSFGSFRRTASVQGGVNTDENIPVDVTQRYRLTYYARQVDTGGATSKNHYSYTAAYDADGNVIRAADVMDVVGSRYTSLAVDLVSGATTITLVDATGWQNAGASTPWQRNINFHNYVNGKGYAYPPYTYSRNGTIAGGAYNSRFVYSDSSIWAAGGISGNVITLRGAYTGPTIPAGTKVSNSSSGGTFDYIPPSNVTTPPEWTRFSGSQGGGAPVTPPTEGGLVPSDQGMFAAPPYPGAPGGTPGFRWGTAFVRLGWLTSYPGVGTSTTDMSMGVCNISFGLDAVLSGQAAADVNSNTTTISGGKIRTGLIESTGYAYTSGNFSTAGMQVNLDNGAIRSTNFGIDASGNAFFKGDLTGASGTFSGALSGATITGGTIAIGAANNIFKADSNGIYLGHATFASAPFRVSPAGALTATSGTVGGWTLGATTLTGTNLVLTNTGNIAAGTANNIVRISADDATFRLWAGHATAASAPFRVTAAGALTATSATVTGTVTATAGAVGGWTLAATTLTGGDMVLTNTGNLVAGTANNVVRISANDATYRLWAGHATAASAPFSVTQAGALVATSATITGSITSTSGSIAGWTLGSTTLTAPSSSIVLTATSTGSVVVGATAGQQIQLLTDGGPKLSIGQGTVGYNLAGIYFDVNTGTPRFSLGVDDFRWDGTTLSIGTDFTYNGGTGVLSIDGGALVAGSVTAAEIEAGTITGTELSATTSIVIGTGTYKVRAIGGAGTATYLGITSAATPAYNNANTPFYAGADQQVSIGDKLTFSGGNLSIAGAISGGTIDIGGDDATSFHVDADGGMWMGASIANKATAPFRVTSGGAITATSGAIAGWTLGATTLTGGSLVLTNTGNIAAGTANNIVRVSADDATFRLWVGHATAASAPFRVTAAGALTATGATISGALTATTGAIGGWTVAATTLTGGAMVLTNTGNLAAGTSNDIVRVSADDATYRLWVGHATAASAPFSVTRAGVLSATGATISGSVTATTGAIGGWTLGATTLTGTNMVLTNTGNLAAGTANNIVRLSADDATFRLWVGHATAASAPFRVTAAGVLTATGATITGTVTATAGAIGGWTLGATTLTGTNMVLTNTGNLAAGTGNNIVRISADDATYRLWAGNAAAASAPFSVTAAGVLTATGATISGSVTATTGAIGGWTLGATTLTGTNMVLTNTGNITAGTSNNVVRISADDATFRLWVGHATAASAPFRVTTAGVLTATGATITGSVTATTGAIGGWTLGATTLTGTNMVLTNTGNLAAGTGNNIVRISADDATYRIWAGNATAASAPFSVTTAGVLNATGATITGSVTATTGAIGGWTLGATTLTGTNMVLTNTGNLAAGTSNNIVRISADDATWRLWAGHATAASAPFRVSAAGALTATSATITGTITSSAATINGGTISSATYSYTSGSYSTAGIQIGMGTEGYIRAKNFGIDGSGNASFRGSGVFEGTVTASSGSIGLIDIGEVTAGQGTQGMYVGTGVWNTSATPFYIDDAGDFSLGSKLRYDASASTLYVEGDAVIDGTLSGTAITAGTLSGDSIIANTKIKIGDGDTYITLQGDDDTSNTAVTVAHHQDYSFQLGATQYLQIAAAATPTITTPLSIVLHVALDSWKTASTQTLASSIDTGVNGGYELAITSAGYLQLATSDGTSLVTTTGTTDISTMFEDKRAYWIRCDFTPDTGSNRVAGFYWADSQNEEPGPNDWTLIIGSGISTPTTITDPTGANGFRVGRRASTSTPNAAPGRYYRSTLRRGVGVPALWFDNTTAATLEASSIPDNANLTPTDDHAIRLKFRVSPPGTWAGSQTNVTLAGQWTTTGDQRAWKITMDELTGEIAFYVSLDGTAAKTHKVASVFYDQDNVITNDGSVQIAYTCVIGSGTNSSPAMHISYDDGKSWKQGPWSAPSPTVSPAAYLLPFNSTSPLYLGDVDDAGGSEIGIGAASGAIYEFDLYTDTPFVLFGQNNSFWTVNPYYWYLGNVANPPSPVLSIRPDSFPHSVVGSFTVNTGQTLTVGSGVVLNPRPETLIEIGRGDRPTNDGDTTFTATSAQTVSVVSAPEIFTGSYRSSTTPLYSDGLGQFSIGDSMWYDEVDGLSVQGNLTGTGFVLQRPDGSPQAKLVSRAAPDIVNPNYRTYDSIDFPTPLTNTGDSSLFWENEFSTSNIGPITRFGLLGGAPKYISGQPPEGPSVEVQAADHDTRGYSEASLRSGQKILSSGAASVVARGFGSELSSGTWSAVGQNRRGTVQLNAVGYNGSGQYITGFIELHAGGTDSFAAAQKSRLNINVGAVLVRNVEVNIVGEIRMWAGSKTGATLPQGWMFCDGAAVSSTEYPELFAVIGTKYGFGVDGYYDFSLPNAASNNVPQGISANANTRNTQLSTGNNSANHSHGVSINTGNVSADHSHGVSINTGNVSAWHTHNYGYGNPGTAKPTSNPSANHFHSAVGNTGGISANHTHLVSGNTGNQSANHSHIVNSLQVAYIINVGAPT